MPRRRKTAAAAAADPAAASASAAAPRRRRGKGRRKSASGKPRTRGRGRRSQAMTTTTTTKPTRRRTGGAASLVKIKPGQILIDGGLVIIGSIGALKLNQVVKARPMGLKPTTIALVVTVGVAVATRKRYRKVSRGAACLAVGIATGIIAETVLEKGASPAV